eukprot:1150021-Pelagomonas_calceolata.AAC.2
MMSGEASSHFVSRCNSKSFVVFRWVLQLLQVTSEEERYTGHELLIFSATPGPCCQSKDWQPCVSNVGNSQNQILAATSTLINECYKS